MPQQSDILRRTNFYTTWRLLAYQSGCTILKALTSTTSKQTHKHVPQVTEDCPYEYLLNVYGRHHFAGFVRKLDATLETRDSKKWQMILEIMDGIHFCLILVDDITDNSSFRKGKPAAHTIFGPHETANRAYLSLTRIMNKTLCEQPQLYPFLLQNLEEILEGQDISLVWRRDGLSRLPLGHEERVNAYRRSAYLKTGALFRLVGQLVAEDDSNDDLMTRVGWYCHLQNDCKNVYSTDYAKAKGAFAEDLRNGEFSYPIILALNEPNGSLVKNVLEEGGSEKDFEKALAVVQSDKVKGKCLSELKEVGKEVKDFVEIWGRKENLDKGGDSAT
ncbi:terpenoid synthase [Lepidopterella palustris CBS 459.81]|uniref:geranylgeranyl diphosphate synthase n=1 Tax=Lepidopterella palustris CBS 459.81 TaxID=1314670 RepID=A0A8E2ECW7_9PEZI|nr:terpenoid synthase [Lepidopterella palustris CBS 459.81]